MGCRYDLPVSGSVTALPAICLNMIVRNEAHVVTETLDAVAPYISSWVIVDTGSNDGTQDVIRNHMTRLGIAGDLHERPWRDFGHNRSEALNLAQGRGDYIWVVDADDVVVGAPDFAELTAEIYMLRVKTKEAIVWKPQLFRDGLPIRYKGLVHESLECDRECDVARLEGDYHIEYRHLGARSQDPQTFARDRDLLLAQVKEAPEDAQSVIHLAQSYFYLRDYENARKWYARRIELGGNEEEVFHCKYRIGECIAQGGGSWPDVQDAFLTAWEYRPTRAEALYVIAAQYRSTERYLLGYQFAKLAAEIPFPEGDTLLTQADIHAFRAAEEQAVCASMLGRQAEAFGIFRRILARPDVPDSERVRVARNRDVCVPVIINEACAYPEELVQRLAHDPRTGDITLSLIIGPDRDPAIYTLNSFLNCCTDISRIERFLAVDAGLSVGDRATLEAMYPFLEFSPAEGSGVHLAEIRSQVDGRLWLHLGRGWTFFAPENLASRLAAVLDAEPTVLQVGINFADSANITGTCAVGSEVRRADNAGHYVVGKSWTHGPAMFDTARLEEVGGIDSDALDPIGDLGRRASSAGRDAATLDEVLCISVSTSTPTL